MIKREDVQIIALKCPNCGGALRVPEGTDNALCEHCGSSVLIADGRAGRTSPVTPAVNPQLSEAAKKRVLKIVLWGTVISVGIPIIATAIIFIIIAVVFLLLGLGLVGSGG